MVSGIQTGAKRKMATHQYSTTGIKTVRLEVKDVEEATSTATKEVKVVEKIGDIYVEMVCMEMM